MAQSIVGTEPKHLHSSRCIRRASNFIRKSTRPGYHLFQLLPSSRCYRLIKTQTNRFKNTIFFFATALTMRNTNKSCPVFFPVWVWLSVVNMCGVCFCHNMWQHICASAPGTFQGELYRTIFGCLFLNIALLGTLFFCTIFCFYIVWMKCDFVMNAHDIS